MGELTLEERGRLIVDACLKQTSTSPYQVFMNVARQDFVRMHGPEHHVLDGAALLSAYRNAGGDVDLAAALAELMSRGLKMPGAMCGRWGVCGATASIGAALSILEQTGPLSDDDSWGSHMRYTSRALDGLSRIGGPRCCKRTGFTAILEAVAFAREQGGVSMEAPEKVTCAFSGGNRECLREKCPYYPGA